jgi:hypothetical protein
VSSIFPAACSLFAIEWGFNSENRRHLKINTIMKKIVTINDELDKLLEVFKKSGKKGVGYERVPCP